MKIATAIWITALGITLTSQLCLGQGITVAAAADLQFAMQDLAARFQQQTGNTVKVVYGSSGNFFQQIQQGAPFDMFFSANLDYPRRLDSDGLIEKGSYYEYARGEIVIWVPNDSKIDVGLGLKALLNPGVRKIAIANPVHAPYGQAAVAAMQKEGIYEKVRDKLVFGENISQTASFVMSRSADVGLVAFSLALSPNMKDKGRYAQVPVEEYPPIEQACVILNSSRNKIMARQFLSFIKTDVAAETLRKNGFGVPGHFSK